MSESDCAFLLLGLARNTLGNSYIPNSPSSLNGVRQEQLHFEGDLLSPSSSSSSVSNSCGSSSTEGEEDNDVGHRNFKNVKKDENWLGVDGIDDDEEIAVATVYNALTLALKQQQQQQQQEQQEQKQSQQENVPKRKRDNNWIREPLVGRDREKQKNIRRSLGRNKHSTHKKIVNKDHDDGEIDAVDDTVEEAFKGNYSESYNTCTKFDNEAEKTLKEEEDDEDPDEEIGGISISRMGRSRKPVSRRTFSRKKLSRWTKEESEKLLLLVRKYPDGGISRNRWTSISENMGGKSSSQCFQHWFRVLDPSIRKGPWKEEEEEILLKLVSEYEKNYQKIPWAAVATKIVGRTDTQCRYHFNTITRSQKCPWSKDEDRILIQIIKERSSGTLTWVEVAKELYNELTRNKQTQFKCPPRSALDCKKRFLLLQ